MLWLITFSPRTPGSVNLLYILISRAYSALLRCQPWMKIYGRLAGGRIPPAVQPGASERAGKRKTKLISFPFSFPTCACGTLPAESRSNVIISHYLLREAQSSFGPSWYAGDLGSWSSVTISLSGFSGWFQTPAPPFPTQHPAGCDLRDF